MAQFLLYSGNYPDWGFSCPTPTLGNLHNKTGLEAFWSFSGWANVTNASSPGKLRNFPSMKLQPQSRQLSEPWSCNILSFADNSASVSKPQDQGQAQHAEENLHQPAQNSDTERWPRPEKNRRAAHWHVWMQSMLAITFHSGILMRIKGEVWRLYGHFICVLKIPSNSFKMSISLQH